MDLSKLTIEELESYERVTRIVCSKYENAVKGYTGEILGQNHEALESFDVFNKQYSKILSEIEKRIKEL